MKVKVPDVPHPTAELCYAQAPDMTRCDRKRGHAWLHSWEAYEKIRDLEAQQATK